MLNLNKHQENTLSDYDDIIQILDDNADKTSKLTGFDDSISGLKGIVDNIKTKAAEKVGATAGKAAAKDASEDCLVRALLPVALSLVILGRKMNDLPLKEKGTVTETALRKMRDQSLLIKATDIYNTALSRAADLVSVGVDAQKLAALKATIDDYEAKSKARESGVSQQVGATTTLGDLFKDAREVLDEEIDGFMEHMRDPYPEFYTEYHNARHVKNYGVRHRNGGNNPSPAPAPAQQK